MQAGFHYDSLVLGAFSFICHFIASPFIRNLTVGNDSHISSLSVRREVRACLRYNRAPLPVGI